jgi:ATPase subunit of ABC transporter with duplicated ATPase domains
LILDEPTNHLDQKVIKQILDNLETLDFKPAVILVSHDPQVAGFAKTNFSLVNPGS